MKMCFGEDWKNTTKKKKKTQTHRTPKTPKPKPKQNKTKKIACEEKQTTTTEEPHMENGEAQHYGHGTDHRA